ncbi:MAG: competence/damage-inducible protein A [Dysgonamonadaceae bacterium]|jgi:nicotinamide-nucleotide amidase|nr:competence/damage-inducible protein A [Dysgonamonadaceae bacterium]
MVNVEIITIGDELLIGQVVDTNSTWIAQELNKIGFDVLYKSTVGDNEKDILDAFDKAFSRVSAILVTGGIGPTKDDITKKTLCKYFDSKLIFNDDVLKNIEALFNRSGRTINELTHDQAYVPDKCTVIQNIAGTAPCTWFEKDGKILVSMPGVPYEMKSLMGNEVVSRLQKFFHQTDSIQHQTFWVNHFSESALAMHLETFENELPENLRLAYLPAAGIIRLRITGKHICESFLSSQMAEQKTKLLELLGNNIFSEEDRPLEILIKDFFEENNLTLSVAESCTGGNIARQLTTIPGSSVYFKGGVVSYANEAKENILHVNTSDIEQYGAVSQQVVEQMAKGAQKILNTDCSIATSGIAGPGGGTETKPVGTVWIAVCYKEEMKSQKFLFGKIRENNIQRATNAALTMLYELVRNDNRT